MTSSHFSDAPCTEDSITVVNRHCLNSPDPMFCVESNISGVAYFTNETGKLLVDFPVSEDDGDCS